MKLALILVALVSLSLVGCGGISEGVVIEKKYEKAEHWEEYDSCKTSYYTPDTNDDGMMERQCIGGYENKYDDPDFKIKIQHCEEEGTSGVSGSDGKSTYKKECKTNWVDVGPELFMSLKIGQYFDGQGRVRDWDSDHKGWGLG